MDAPRWAAPTSVALSVAGIGVSTYLTLVYLAAPDLLVCTEAGIVSCDAVLRSPQSTFLGVPVPLLGLAWFVAMLGLSLPAAWRARVSAVHLARLAAAVAGIGFVLWLLYAELVLIGAICLWCTIAHVLAFGLFAIVVLTAPDLLAREAEPHPYS
jgi:uncharacterized membrane protein